MQLWKVLSGNMVNEKKNIISHTEIQTSVAFFRWTLSSRGIMLHKSIGLIQNRVWLTSYDLNQLGPWGVYVFDLRYSFPLARCISRPNVPQICGLKSLLIKAWGSQTKSIEALESQTQQKNNCFSVRPRTHAVKKVPGSHKFYSNLTQNPLFWFKFVGPGHLFYSMCTSP